MQPELTQPDGRRSPVRPNRVPLPIWRWGVLEAFLSALCAGPTASFVSAFAVELGAGGGLLGFLLALTTFLTNGLQLQGAAWARRASGSARVYGAAIVARGTWLLAGTAPAVIAIAGYADGALWAFIACLGVASIASAGSTPTMGSRASTAGGDLGRTRYLADRAIATWVGSLAGTAAITGILVLIPGVGGYALGFTLAAIAGLLGILAYRTLVRADRRLAVPPDRGSVAALPAVAGPLSARAQGSVRPVGVWGHIARRVGAPAAPVLGSIVIGAAILQGGASMIGPAAPIWLVRHLGIPASYLGALSLLGSLTAIASQRLWARWIDRAGPGRVLEVAGALAALIPIGWMLVVDPWVAIPLNLFSGVAWGGYSLAMTARLLQLAPAPERSAYLGAYAGAVGLSGAVGSLVAGALAAAIPIEWIPLIFFASFATRGFGWWSLRGASAS